MDSRLKIYAGTFSENSFSFVFDPDTAEVEGLHAIRDEFGRSAWFTLDSSGRYLYIANEYEGGEGGIAAYRLVKDGDPVFIDAMPSDSQGLTYVSVMTVGGRQFVLGSGYFDADIMVCPIGDDGRLLPMSDRFILSRGGHAHCIRSVPGTDLVLIPDTMYGHIYTFQLTSEGKLEKRSVFYSSDLQYPRHIEFSEDSETIYVVTEATSTLQVFHLDKCTGELKRTFCCSNLPDGYVIPEGHSSAAIHRSPDGRFLYLSNRGHDSITVYSLEGGKISKAGYAAGEIEWPREFMITPDGDHMFVGNETAGSFSIFRMDKDTGMPSYTGKTISLPGEGPGPVCFIVSPVN